LSAMVGSIDISAPVSIVFGEAVAPAAVNTQLASFGSSRVLLVTGETVRHTRAFAAIEAAIGQRLGAVFSDLRPHLPRPVVLEGARVFRALSADAVVSLGGGTCSDAGKAIRLAVALGIETESDFDNVERVTHASAGAGAAPQIAIPTTLAGAEFTQVAGITDPTRHEKQVFGGPGFAPRVTVLDPLMTEEIPLELWRMGALKVLSDAIEVLTLPDLNPALTPLAEHSVALITRALSGNKLTTPQSRLQLQLATWMGMFAITQSKTKLGLATVLRHVLGPGLGAAHAAVAAALIVPVYRFNAGDLDTDRHDALARSLGVAAQGNREQAIATKLTALTAPAVTGLRDFGSSLEILAGFSAAIAEETGTTTNPRKGVTASEISELLTSAY
jgi:alcohol dehydrogenase class IV